MNLTALWNKANNIPFVKSVIFRFPLVTKYINVKYVEMIIEERLNLKER